MRIASMRTAAAGRKPGNSRRGITIIEVLIVVTCVTMMLGLCAVSIQLLMRLSGDGVSRYGAAVAFERLARQLRDDAHSSTIAESTFDQKAESKTQRVELTLDSDHRVTYQFQDGAVVRTESAAGKVVRHDSYSLPLGASARFGLRDEGPSRMMALVVTRSSGKSKTEPPRPLEVVAQIGKDRHGISAKTGAQPR